jgi:glycosyltransferase involved in cell wall biosynthesis
MITRDRPVLAARAISCFADQRYPVRELVVVCQGTADYRRHLTSLVRENAVAEVRIVGAAPELSLGALRNLSLDAADGELVCVWDDDDCSHPDRLRTQVTELVGNRSHTSFLGDHLQLFEEDRALYWIDWDLGSPKAVYPLLPSTMLMTHDRQFRYPESGPRAHFGEDWSLLTDLHRQVPVSYVRDQGHLYLYNYHGHNTFPAAHHKKLRIRSRPGAAIAERELEVRAAMAYYAVPNPVWVHGSDGLVFCIDD